MNPRSIHKILTYLLATVWLINGLYCKVLHFVPRHQQIVARILGDEYARPLTILIGISEIGMVVWLLSGRQTRLCAWAQMIIVSAMNIVEFYLVPDLLLWGRVNALFALLFVALVYYTEFILNKKLIKQL
jgi:uncharacterized membrane protein YphA (DoxX/SURF4 family)